VVYFKALSHNLSGGEVVGVLELDAIIRHGWFVRRLRRMRWLCQTGFSTHGFFSLPPASAGLLLGLIFDPEYGGDMFLWNVGISLKYRLYNPKTVLFKENAFYSIIIYVSLVEILFVSSTTCSGLPMPIKQSSETKSGVNRTE
jgi:hypothetical protein